MMHYLILLLTYSIVSLVVHGDVLCHKQCENATISIQDCLRNCIQLQDTICDPKKWKLPIDGKYQTNVQIHSMKLNVHLIPHSHDDPGWLLDIDAYYNQRVQYIIDTVIQELQENKDRTFMYVEQSFFQRWWKEQSKSMRNIVKTLVANGQLDLTANGGWCMHDEATTHYLAMLDQTSYGHQFLKQEFNISPRIGWQIDPFGHSSTQGSLLSAGIGFDALYFARIDYQDYTTRLQSKNLEFLWRPSKSRGKTQQVFTGDIINHYSAPRGFIYDSDPGIQDDPNLHDFDVCQQVDKFIKDSLMRGNATKGNHIFIPMGADFAYQNARKWYKNMDKLIHYVNQNGSINVLYSNLSYYTDLKLAEEISWTVKTDDFFPYAYVQSQYWTGFYTSRPKLKYYARFSNRFLQASHQLAAIYISSKHVDFDLLERAVGLVQHHDALTGTETEAVTNDYINRMFEGYVDALQVLQSVIFTDPIAENNKLCLLSRISNCRIPKENDTYFVLVHNALPRGITHTIEIPFMSKADVRVINQKGVLVRSHIVKSIPIHPNAAAPFPYLILVTLRQGPLMDTFIQLSASKENTRYEEGKNQGQLSVQNDLTTAIHHRPVEDKHLDSQNVTLENKWLLVTLDKETGCITSIRNKIHQLTIPVTSSIGYYHAVGGHHGSGAYVFRPESKKVHMLGKATIVDVSHQPIDYEDENKHQHINRIVFKIGDWVRLQYKLSNEDDFIDIEWFVGPVDINDNKGKEVIFRFDTKKHINTEKAWYTDSNGLEFIRRVRSYRETWPLKLRNEQDFVAGNYYPMTTGAYIKDDHQQLNIVTDRAQGVSSLEDGQIEVMVHRRLVGDDGKSMREHLNETESYYDVIHNKQITEGITVAGNLYININNVKEGMRSIRRKMEHVFYHPIALLSPNSRNPLNPWLQITSFPENIGLTTLKKLSKSCIFVRLTHLYAVDEHYKLSKSVSFNFSSYFGGEGSRLQDVTEFMLTGTGPISEARKTKKLKWIGENDDDDMKISDVSMPMPLHGTVVELQPMEVRAFKLCFDTLGDSKIEQGSAKSDTFQIPTIVNKVLALE